MTSSSSSVLSSSFFCLFFQLLLFFFLNIDLPLSFRRFLLPLPLLSVNINSTLFLCILCIVSSRWFPSLAISLLLFFVSFPTCFHVWPVLSSVSTEKIKEEEDLPEFFVLGVYVLRTFFYSPPFLCRLFPSFLYFQLPLPPWGFFSVPVCSFAPRASFYLYILLQVK